MFCIHYLRGDSPHMHSRYQLRVERKASKARKIVNYANLGSFKVSCERNLRQRERLEAYDKVPFFVANLSTARSLYWMVELPACMRVRKKSEIWNFLQILQGRTYILWDAQWFSRQLEGEFSAASNSWTLSLCTTIANQVVQVSL